ncbi:16599_t:CDS:2 [Funneliformis geosporum]|uniref:16599_t:CDS:1 n=1 Tax=Funneliformis geosporum TaxID=1117311 RepID=A0A9W4WU40_9GLOM|nr:16599_t:CDS:2 [Funneliformis geosporum]
MWPQCLISSCDEVLAQCRTYFSPNVIEKYVVAFKLDAEDDNPHYQNGKPKVYQEKYETAKDGWPKSCMKEGVFISR